MWESGPGAAAEVPGQDAGTWAARRHTLATTVFLRGEPTARRAGVRLDHFVAKGPL